MADKKPSQEFLSMVIILLRKCQAETGESLVSWLEQFEDPSFDFDVYDDNQVRLAISKLKKELYPEEPKPLNRDDWLDDDDDDTPPVQQLDEPDEPVVADAIHEHQPPPIFAKVQD